MLLQALTLQVIGSGRQGRQREVGSGGFAEPEAKLRLEEHEPHARLIQPGELASDNKARCNQGLEGVNVARVPGKSRFLPGETCYPANQVSLVGMSD
jgi:hypothetical protein